MEGFSGFREQILIGEEGRESTAKTNVDNYTKIAFKFAKLILKRFAGNKTDFEL